MVENLNTEKNTGIFYEQSLLEQEGPLLSLSLENVFLQKIKVSSSIILECITMTTFAFYTFRILELDHDNEAKRSEKCISKPPFSMLLHISRLLPDTYRRALEQEISDMRIEYIETVLRRDIMRARMILISYYFGLGWSFIRSTYSYLFLKLNLVD